MESSPKGRQIEYVEGSPDEIIERGNAITTLGDQMLESACVLEDIKNNALEYGSQQGKAIEKLRDSIGDSFETLRKAGELYQPVGPVITAYGLALDDVQPLIKSAVDDCEDRWSHYASLPGDKDDSHTADDGGFLGLGDTDEEEAADNQAKQAAYDAWVERAEDFDRHYDTWEDAFDTAVEQIGDEMAGSIKDSFWSTLTDFLEIAALVVGIAALIIGGPIAAAIALAVGAALLITTIMSYANGERGKWDIALAAVGVVPFGKVSSLAKVSHLGKGASKVAVVKSATGVGKLDGLGKAATDLVQNGKVFHADGLVGIFRNRGAASGFQKILTGSEAGFTSVYRTHKSFYQGPGEVLQALRNSNFTRGAAGVDYVSSGVANAIYHIGNLDKATGGALPDLPKPIQFAF